MSLSSRLRRGADTLKHADVGGEATLAAVVLENFRCRFEAIAGSNPEHLPLAMDLQTSSDLTAGEAGEVGSS